MPLPWDDLGDARYWRDLDAGCDMCDSKVAAIGNPEEAPDTRDEERSVILTLIRHAPTSHNNNGIYMGASDEPLSAAGESAAARMRDQGAAGDHDWYFCSPLARAVRTAEILFPRARLELDKRLSERSMGIWEGRSRNFVYERFPSAFDRRGVLRLGYCPPGGEGMENLFERVRSFLCNVMQLEYAPTRNRIVVVTHNGVVRAFRSILENRDVEAGLEEDEPHLAPRTYALLRTARGCAEQQSAHN